MFITATKKISAAESGHFIIRYEHRLPSATTTLLSRRSRGPIRLHSRWPQAGQLSLVLNGDTSEHSTILWHSHGGGFKISGFYIGDQDNTFGRAYAHFDKLSPAPARIRVDHHVLSTRTMSRFHERSPVIGTPGIGHTATAGRESMPPCRYRCHLYRQSFIIHRRVSR
jgi:hypothetical protein